MRVISEFLLWSINFFLLTLCVQLFEIKIQYISRVDPSKLPVGFSDPLFGMPDTKFNVSSYLRHAKKVKMCMYILPIFVNQFVHSFKLKLKFFDEVCSSMHLNHVQIELRLS